MTDPTVFHPIVTQMHPSAEQTPAVQARGRDVVVVAGAGAGKTRTLVARYLALLAEGCPLRGVIAITFTEKAAREMRNRVRDEVRRYLELPDLPAAERTRWQDLYSGLDAARISTIHSLCAEILHSHPAEADVDPHFTVLDPGQAGLLRRQALDETLAWVVEKPDLVPLFDLLGEDDLRTTLDTLIQRRLEAAAAFSALPTDVLAFWQRSLESQQADALQALLSSENWLEAVEVVSVEAANDPTDLIEVQRQDAAVVLRDVAQARDVEERLAILAKLDNIRLTGGSAKKWPGAKVQLDSVKDALKTLRESWQASEILRLTLTPLDEALAKAMPALGACFEFAHNRYISLKRVREALDFDDLEAGALRLLAQDPAVQSRWQAEAVALLVDEFQDTNDRQRQLVRHLNGREHKLFIVGDAKQSIYRFRGADVAVFRDERETIDHAGGAVFPMHTSYRAHRELVAGLNDLLRPVLGDREDPARRWVEPFAPLHHHREAAGPGFNAPHIELHLALGSKSDDGLAQAADVLAARLVELVESGSTQVEDNGTRRPLEYGDVAILCRASTSFSAYENALERAGVPFLTVAGRGFYGRPEIRDLLNALAALADPTDDLALAGLLRSPAIALTDAALFQLCQVRDPNDSLWRTLQVADLHLSPEDAGRAARAVQLIDDLHTQACRTPVADLLKAFLDATGCRAALIAAGQARAARNVAKLLADAHISGMVGVTEFLAYVGDLRDSGTRESEARATAEGAVQIMSVHAAKGLEFPVVVVGDVTYQSRTVPRLLLDPDLGVLLARKDDDKQLPAIYRLARLTHDDQEAAESDRLLYVAATRAREKLIFSGCITAKQDGTPGKLVGWLGRLCGTGGLGLDTKQVALDDDDPHPRSIDLPGGSTPVACVCYGAGWTSPVPPRPSAAPADVDVTLPPPLLAPVAAEPVTVDEPTREQARDPGRRVWRVVPAVARARAPAWVIGKLVHEALAAWRFPTADGAFDRWADAHARSYGLTDIEQVRDAAAASRRLLQRFHEHPLCTEMATANRRLHEVPYSLLTDDGQLQSGIIDALYQRDGRWTIVEFKTDRLRDAAALDQLLAREDYLAQTARYAAAVEQLLGARPGVVLCFFDFGGIVRLLNYPEFTQVTPTR